VIPRQDEPRIAVLCASFGRVARGIETVVEELCLRRLGQHYPIDLYGPPEAPELPAPHRVIRIPCRPRTDDKVKIYDDICRLLHWPMPGGHNYEVLTYTLALLDSPFMGNSYLAVFNYAGPYAGLLCRGKRFFDGSRFIHSGQAGRGPVEVMQARLGPDHYIPLSVPARTWLQRKRLLSGWGPVIPNGVDTEYFKPGPGITVGVPRPIFFFAGALDDMKRPLLAVEAVARTNGSLLMAGDGELADEVARRGNELLGERFKLLGEVSREEMLSCYNGCDIFTLPSFAEPFGIVLLEAMACGKPVVTQRDEIREWLVGDAGLLCECADIAAYADTLKAAVEQDWGEEPRNRAGQFDWSRICEQYLVLLQDMALAG